MKEKEKKLKKEISSIFDKPAGGKLLPAPPPVEKAKRAVTLKTLKKRGLGGDILGLDIGSSKVAVVELRDNNVINFGFREIDPHLRTEERNTAIRGAIQNIIETYKIRTKKTSVVLSSTEMLSRVWEYPQMPIDELRQIVKRESEKFLPPILKDGVFDVSSIIETKREGAKLNYITFFASSSLVNSVVGAVEQAGLYPVSITGGEFILKQKFGQETKDVQALIDIGADITTVVIVNDGVFRFSRYISRGGNNFTQAVATGLDTGFKHAEELKRAEGSLSPSSRLFEYLKREGDRLAEEIRITLNYHNQKFRGETVKSIGLIGGGSQLDGIDTYLSEILGVNVRKLDPSRSLNLAMLEKQQKRGIFESWLPRLSMAIGAAEYFPFSINLLAKRLEKERMQAKQRKMVISSIVGVLLLLTSTYTPLMVKRIKLASTLKAKQTKMDGLKPLASRAEELEELNEEIQKRLSYIEDYNSGRVENWSVVFGRISKTIPESIWINNLSFLSEDSLYLIIQGSALNEADIVHWRLILEESGFIEGIELGDIQTRQIAERNIADFEFKCRLLAGEVK